MRSPLFVQTPYWGVGRTPLRINYTSSIKLSCPFDGAPKPTLTWYKNGDPLIIRNIDGSIAYDEVTQTLTISRAVPADQGIYTCT
jgi:hypothetical protein